MSDELESICDFAIVTDPKGYADACLEQMLTGQPIVIVPPIHDALPDDTE